MDRMVTENPHYESLGNLIPKGDVIAFVGAGLSAPLYSDWKKLINKLCEDCSYPAPKIDSTLPDEQIAELLLKSAEECKTNDKVAYENCLRRELSPKRLNIPRTYLKLVQIPFKAFITINIDSLILRAFDDQGRPKPKVLIQPQLPIAELRDSNIFHVHGAIEDENGNDHVGSVILTLSDFNYIYADKHTQSFFVQLLDYHNVLFLGTSLSDKRFNDLLRITREFQERQESMKIHKSKQRYAIIEYKDNEEQREKEDENFQEFGIDIIRYPLSGNPDEDKYYHLFIILQDLLERCKRYKNGNARILGGTQ